MEQKVGRKVGGKSDHLEAGNFCGHIIMLFLLVVHILYTVRAGISAGRYILRVNTKIMRPHKPVCSCLFVRDK